MTNTIDKNIAALKKSTSGVQNLVDSILKDLTEQALVHGSTQKVGAFIAACMGSGKKGVDLIAVAQWARDFSFFSWDKDGKGKLSPSARDAYIKEHAATQIPTGTKGDELANLKIKRATEAWNVWVLDTARPTWFNHGRPSPEGSSKIFDPAHDLERLLKKFQKESAAPELRDALERALAIAKGEVTPEDTAA